MYWIIKVKFVFEMEILFKFYFKQIFKDTWSYFFIETLKL